MNICFCSSHLQLYKVFYNVYVTLKDFCSSKSRKQVTFLKLHVQNDLFVRAFKTIMWPFDFLFTCLATHTHQRGNIQTTSHKIWQRIIDHSAEAYRQGACISNAEEKSKWRRTCKFISHVSFNLIYSNLFLIKKKIDKCICIMFLEITCL